MGVLLGLAEARIRYPGEAGMRLSVEPGGAGESRLNARGRFSQGAGKGRVGACPGVRRQVETG